MKVFIAGATGAIGGPLIAELLAQGHTVVALTRSADKIPALARQGVEAAVADVFDADSLKEAVRRARPDVVIEQLTALPKTYTRESMSAAAAMNHRIRLEGGANVLAAAEAAGVPRYLRQSIAFWGTPGAGLADEETPLTSASAPGVAADVGVIAEIERRLLQHRNIEGIAMRYGFFYGSGTWFAPDGDVAQQVRRQQFPIVGSGAGVWSWLHIEDAAKATVAAAGQGNAGIYQIVDDRPLPVRQWLPAFARWLGAPRPPQLSEEEALMAGAADALYYGAQMRGASNAKAKRELGFRPRPLEWIADVPVAAAN